MKTTLLVSLALALLAFRVQEVDGQPGIRQIAKNGKWLLMLIRSGF